MKRKEAIEVIKKNWPDSSFTMLREALETLIPELKESKESEDERVKKAIKYGLDYVFTNNTTVYETTKEQCLAWLEKQGKQKPIIEMKTPEESLGVDSDTYNKIVDECIYGEQKPADVRTTGYWHVEDVEQKPAWSEEDEMHIRELESLVKQVWATAERGNDKETIHKMSDLSFFLKTLKPHLKQEWSEEDSYMLGQAIKCVNNSGKLDVSTEEIEDWLKSLKDHVQPKQEWSEKDEKTLDSILSCIEHCRTEDIESQYNGNRNIDLKRYEPMSNWLKSLRPQEQWKPSEELITYLYEAIDIIEEQEKYSIVTALRELYKQLKQL